MPSLSNLTTFEETSGLNGGITLTFPWKAKRLTITNDSSTKALKWKFKEGHDWATLKVGETVSMELSIDQVMLESSGATYRVWGVG